MKKDSSVTRALKEVPLFAARYENFIKRPSLQRQLPDETNIRLSFISYPSVSTFSIAARRFTASTLLPRFFSCSPERM